MFYYPAQPMPFAGMCGPGFCGGEFLGSVELEDESDFNRIFGIVETCPNATTVSWALGGRWTSEWARGNED